MKQAMCPRWLIRPTSISKILHMGVSLAAVVAALFLAAAAPAQEKTLRIIGWEGYMDESFTKAFTEKTGYKVAATYAGTSDEMYAKIKAGGGKTYDMVTASGDLTRRLYDSGLLEPVNLDKVPNYKHLFPFLHRPPYNTFKGQPHGVSIAWGPDLLIYDKSIVKEEPKSWMILYDEKYKNKVALNDYAIIIADLALWEGGHKNIYELTKQDLEKIKPNLMKLRPQVRKFWSSQGELAQLFLNKEIALGWGWPVTIVELKKAGFPVGYTIPKEGTTGWSDSWMIIKGSPNAEIAHQWMNYMLEGEPQKKMSDVSGYWPASRLAIPLLGEDMKKDMHIDDVESYFKTIRFWETVQNYDDWTALWNEFRGQ
jgi:spermidine/putrescine-binding protein